MMDEELEQALAASRPEQAELLIDLVSSEDEEDDDLDALVHIKNSDSSRLQILKKDGGPGTKEVTRLSKLESGAKSSTASTIEDQPIERSPRMKRKAEGELRPHGVKRSSSTSLAMNMASARSSGSIPRASTISSDTASGIPIAYPNGGLRITRTPGRQKTKNCVNLKDIIHKQHLVSACVFSFFIAEEEFFEHFPFSHSSDAVPIYIGRDAKMDQMIQQACSQAGIAFEDKLTKKQLQTITPNLRQLYSQQYGKNYHAFYAWSSGSSHSKILLLEYPEFLRIVITSCNMMEIDTVFGDNHWYIHDVPRLLSRAKDERSGFEADLLTHLQALGTPDEFVDSIRGKYDYSAVKVHLVTSVPGVCSGVKAETHGLLRLRRVVRNLGLKLPDKQDEGKLRLEVCAASIGNLSAKWLNGFHDCVLGRQTIEVAGEDCAVPDLKLFYPTVGDVKKACDSAQLAASNIGCHTRPWDNAPNTIKNIFHHYESKDTGRLFHQKLILAYNPRDTTTQPYYVYVGSANLSQSAWGALEQDKKANEATCNVKLIKLTNFECGVVVPGYLVDSLLEEGTKTWLDGTVPYVQTTKRYDLQKDRPWNDPRWVQDYKEDYRGA